MVVSTVVRRVAGTGSTDGAAPVSVQATVKAILFLLPRLLHWSLWTHFWTTSKAVFPVSTHVPQTSLAVVHPVLAVQAVLDEQVAKAVALVPGAAVPEAQLPSIRSSMVTPWADTEARKRAIT